jgi:Uma2 family endonuclease
VREVWVINAQTLLTHVHCRPGIDGYRDKPEFAPDRALVPDFTPGLAITLGTLELI